jgi:hypothetical protein
MSTEIENTVIDASNPRHSWEQEKRNAARSFVVPSHPLPNYQPQLISSRIPNEAAGLGQRRQIRYVLPAPFCHSG